MDAHQHDLFLGLPARGPAPARPEPSLEAQAREVLVVGVDDWAIADAAAHLSAAGRKVHRCSESAEAPFPCNALVPGRGCPLDRRAIDVVLDVHSSARPGLRLSEMGAVCGLRSGLPLVVAGISDGSVLAPWAHEIPVGGEIVPNCDEAVRRSQRAKGGRN